MIINYGSFDYISKLGFICEVVRMKARNVSQLVLQFIIYPKITLMYHSVRKIIGAF